MLYQQIKYQVSLKVWLDSGLDILPVTKVSSCWNLAITVYKKNSVVTDRTWLNQNNTIISTAIRQKEWWFGFYVSEIELNI